MVIPELLFSLLLIVVVDGGNVLSGNFSSLNSLSRSYTGLGMFCNSVGNPPYQTRQYIILGFGHSPTTNSTTHTINDDEVEDVKKAFVLAYNGQVSCDTLKGAFRQIESATVIKNDGFTSMNGEIFLEVELVCNACGLTEYVDLFHEQHSNVCPCDLDDEQSLECNCPPVSKHRFIELFNGIFQAISPVTGEKSLNLVKLRQIISTEVPPLDMDNNTDLVSSSFKLIGKKGICLHSGPRSTTEDFLENQAKILAVAPYWWYSWSTVQSDDNSQLVPGVEYISMVWGGKEERLQFDLQSIQQQDCRYVLGFNEPDSKEQANMTVDEAVDLWPRLEALNKPLVSPSFKNALGEWSLDFMEQVNIRGLRVGALGIHHYGGMSPDSFMRKMESIYEEFEMPIVITEMALADWGAGSIEDNIITPEAVLAFMKEVLPWMEEQDWILGYAWYSFEIEDKNGWPSALFDKDNNLTELGKYYSQFKANPSIST